MIRVQVINDKSPSLLITLDTKAGRYFSMVQYNTDHTEFSFNNLSIEEVYEIRKGLIKLEDAIINNQGNAKE